MALVAQGPPAGIRAQMEPSRFSAARDGWKTPQVEHGIPQKEPIPKADGRLSETELNTVTGGDIEQTLRFGYQSSGAGAGKVTF